LDSNAHHTGPTLRDAVKGLFAKLGEDVDVEGAPDVTTTGFPGSPVMAI